MNILILEDEIPAYEKLLKHVELQLSEQIQHDWARSAGEGEAYLRQPNTYDLILSDIELLDGTSIDLFKKVRVDCPIIFCSAYDEYLFDAFQSNGIAYILKPYTQEDIQRAFTKYTSLFKKEPTQNLEPTMLQLVADALLQKKKAFKERFVIKTVKEIHLLMTKDISVIEAAGTFCKMIDNKGSAHIISQNIGSLKESLDPEMFFRINRSQIVNINYIEGMENYFKNRLLLKMRGTQAKILTSSKNTANFRSWLESQ